MEARSGLKRSVDSRMVAGVCGGIAEWLGWDPTLVRIAYVGFSLLSAAFPGILVYLVLWVLMPERDEWEVR
ncbi:PspC domain-containing protein [Myxococcota bacterium]|nr:PspC domain-containing protein [Myxococcota bacterium]